MFTKAVRIMLIAAALATTSAGAATQLLQWSDDSLDDYIDEPTGWAHLCLFTIPGGYTATTSVRYYTAAAGPYSCRLVIYDASRALVTSKDFTVTGSSGWKTENWAVAVAAGADYYVGLESRASGHAWGIDTTAPHHPGYNWYRSPTGTWGPPTNTTWDWMIGLYVDNGTGVAPASLGRVRAAFKE